MKEELKAEFLQYCSDIAADARIVFMDPKEVVFEEGVKMNCFYCGRYGRNWRCPPNLPDIDYPRMFTEFDEGIFLTISFDVTDRAQFESIRSESSVVVHKALLNLEKWLYNHNCPTAISFIGGSCKLCKGGCGKERCNNPSMSRSPIEATGINLIKSAAKFGIDIRFPTDKQLSRTGLLLWQNYDYDDVEDIR